MEKETKGLILSKPIMDNSEWLEFRLMYLPNNTYWVYIYDTETKTEAVPTEIKTKLPPSEFEDDENNSKILYLIFEKWINKNSDIEVSNELKQEFQNMETKLLDSIDAIIRGEEKNNIDNIDKKVYERISKDIESFKKVMIGVETEELKERLKRNFETRTNIGKSKQELGNWLNVNQRVILRKKIGTTHILNKASNGFEKIEFDDLMKLVSDFLGINKVSERDLSDAISYISERVTPEFNYVKFENGIYDLNKGELFKPDTALMTAITTKYNYNPNAKPQEDLISYYLNSSLKKKNKEATEKYIKGVYQYIGYLFTSGNPLTSLLFIIGVSGAGKSILTSLITAIFGVENISDVKLDKLTSDGHYTSFLIGKHLNIAFDSENSYIDDTGTVKQITGNDPLGVNPKGKQGYSLEAEEVPKNIVSANNLPTFKNISEALLERFVIIEFNNKFRNTEKQDKNLLKKIIADPEEIEKFIYNSLEAYKEMINNNEDFILRLNKEDTLKIVNKHTKPINYLVSELFLKYDREAYENDLLECETQEDKDQYRNEVNKINKFCIELARLRGVEIPLNNKNMIKNNQLLKAIKEEFDLIGDVPQQTKQYEGGKEIITEVFKPYTTTTFRLSNNKTCREYFGLILNWDLVRELGLKSKQ